MDLPMNEPSLRTYSKLAKDVITALFWPREVKEALFLSTTAELGKGGGADQARMQLLGQQRTKISACCKRLRFNCLGKHGIIVQLLVSMHLTS